MQLGTMPDEVNVISRRMQLVTMPDEVNVISRSTKSLNRHLPVSLDQMQKPFESGHDFLEKEVVFHRRSGYLLD